MSALLSTTEAPAQSGLAAWADEGLIGQVLDAWLAHAGDAPARGWRREYARHHPQHDPWVVCLYEAADGRLVRLEGLRHGAADTIEHAGLGPLRLVPFLHDAALPGLRQVLARLEHARVVRYRPGKRCTLRGVAAGRASFVKVAPGAEQLYRDALTLWAGYRDGAFSTRVAEPQAWDAGTQSFWQGIVPGRAIVADVRGPGAERIARRLGQALGEIARARLRPSASVDGAAQLVGTRRSIERIASALPALSGRLERVQRELERRHADLPARALVPIHGAPHMHQWLIDDGALGLVDFDRFAWGEPEFDLATFVAELDTERSLATPVAAIEAAMIEGYRAQGIVIDTARATLYRAHKRVSKVLRTAWAVRGDAAERAERHLRSVEALFESA